jgi:hypothetical protein
MKVIYTIIGLVAIVLLGVIAFNSSIGKTLPVHHPGWMSCNGELAQALLYSSLLAQSDDLKGLATKVKQANSVAEIDRLVNGGSNIDASRTEWYASVSDPASCQAQVFLQQPNSDGNNTAYVGYTLEGFSKAGQSEAAVLLNNDVLESIHVNTLGVNWFKQ